MFWFLHNSEHLVQINNQFNHDHVNVSWLVLFVTNTKNIILETKTQLNLLSSVWRRQLVFQTSPKLPSWLDQTKLFKFISWSFDFFLLKWIYQVARLTSDTAKTPRRIFKTQKMFNELTFFCVLTILNGVLAVFEVSPASWKILFKVGTR